jgi:hypothetical protein
MIKTKTKTKTMKGGLKDIMKEYRTVINDATKEKCKKPDF